MAKLQKIWLASLTADEHSAGTNSQIVLIVSQDGEDRLHHTIGETPQTDLERGVANLYEIDLAFSNASLATYGEIDPGRLDRSSIRVGIRGRDRWKPVRLFIFGEDDEGSVHPLGDFSGPIRGISGAEGGFLSTDPKDDVLLDAPIDPGYPLPGARLSVPVPKVEVAPADAALTAVDLLLLTTNEIAAGTDHPLTFQVISADPATPLVDVTLGETAQKYLERGEANLFRVTAERAFTRAEVESVRLALGRSGKWNAHSVFVFGWDEAGRCAPLVHRPKLDSWTALDEHGDCSITITP